MNQQFTIKKLQLLEEDDSYGVAVQRDDGTWEVIASFKHVVDALVYFTEGLIKQDEAEQIQSEKQG